MQLIIEYKLFPSYPGKVRDFKELYAKANSSIRPMVLEMTVLAAISMYGMLCIDIRWNANLPAERHRLHRRSRECIKFDGPDRPIVNDQPGIVE